MLEVVWMEMKKIAYRIKPPCSKCPYKLGLVHTFISPCPQCRENGFGMFEFFQQKTVAGGEKTEREGICGRGS